MKHFSWWASDVTGQAAEKLVDTGLFYGADHADHAAALANAITFLNASTVSVFIIVISLLARLGLNRARSRGGTLQFVPDSSMSSRNFFELLGGGLYGIAKEVLGKDAPRFFWVVGGLFTYILFCNLLGLVPGFLPPSDSLSHNAAMALVVVLIFNLSGLMVNGVGYVKHMCGPWMGLGGIPLNLLLFFIEFLSFLIVRPYSLSLRLMGNMTGDHMVFGIMSGVPAKLIGTESMVTEVLSGIMTALFPILFVALGTLVSLIQAFVFTLLSMIYISLAIAHEDDH
jgi:F-type H+-transporting ATPase subunit a